MRTGCLSRHLRPSTAKQMAMDRYSQQKKIPGSSQKNLLDDRELGRLTASGECYDSIEG
jgi:hypothetical protein